MQTELTQLFQTQGGYLTVQEARTAGFHTAQLQRLLKSGLLEQPQRGVYRLASHPMTSYEDLLEVQLRVDTARVCLISALDLHGLTTTRPSRLQFTIPNKNRFPELSYPPVEVFYFQKDYYSFGQMDLAFEGSPRTIRTYTPEKTLLDLLRYAPRFGRDLYLEGLKNHLKKNSPHRLIETARQAPAGWRKHILEELLHDLEVTLHDLDT